MAMRIFICMALLVARTRADADEVCKGDGCQNTFAHSSLLQKNIVSTKYAVDIGDKPDDLDSENSNNTNNHYLQSTASKLDSLEANEQAEEETEQHPLAFNATEAIHIELAKMKKGAHMPEGVAQIEAMLLTVNMSHADPVSSHRCDAKDTSSTTDQATCNAKATTTECHSVVDSDGNQKCTYQSDGGTQDMENLLSNAKTTINAAANTMVSGLLSSYNNALVDLKDLDDAIDHAKQTISATDLEAIKTKAKTWCTKKRELETATSDASTAAVTLTTKLNAPLDLTDILVKEVAGIGPSDCSKDNGNVKGSTCPSASCNLASRIETTVNTARAEYLAASWDNFEKGELKTTAMTEESNSKGQFQDSVSTTAGTHHSMCDSNDQVHGTAVNLFNNNNAGRASMYRSLGIIQCHINHMTSNQTFNVPTDLLKAGEDSPLSTDAINCVGKLKSAATIQTDLFPVASSSEDSGKTCPTLSAYEDDIRNYGGLGFDKDVADWSPTTTNCVAVSAHATTTPPPAFVDVDTCSHCQTNQDLALVGGSVTCRRIFRSLVWNLEYPQDKTFFRGEAPNAFDICSSGGHSSRDGGTWSNAKAWCKVQGLELWTMTHDKGEWARTAATACTDNMCWMDLRCVADDDTCNTPAGWKWPNGQNLEETGYNRFGKYTTPVMKINYATGKTCANFEGWGGQNSWQPKSCDEYSKVICVNASTNVIGGL